jgi:myosin V
MRTYLLEKSRVVFQAPGERNYHVFYQMCAARDSPDLKELQLEASEAYRFTNQGGDSVIEGVDDAQAFEELRGALTLLGFGAEQQQRVFRILGAVLHLGNVAIVDLHEGESQVAANDKHLAIACKLLEVSGLRLVFKNYVENLIIS